MCVNVSIDFYLVGTQEIVNDIAYIYKVMEMVDARKIEANKEKNEQQQQQKPTQLKLLFRFVLEKGDETENFLRKKPDGNGLLTASATLHTHFGLSWSNESKRHGSIVLESQKQPHKNQYRNSLLA